VSALDYAEHRRSSDVLPYDVAAMVMSVVSVTGAVVAASILRPELMALSALLGLAAAVSKVLSTRAKAAPAGTGRSDRDRRQPEEGRIIGKRGAAVAS
jgi:hypothetical protein